MLATVPVLVRDITDGALPSSPSKFAVLGTTAYFSAENNLDIELFKTDGTSAGTVLVKDINSQGSSQPGSLTPLGTKVLFIADDGVNGAELWSTDGTSGGTVLVKDINPGNGTSDIRYMTVIGGFVYFQADAGVANGGIELWKSDGTSAGTVLVKDINTTAQGPGGVPANLVNVGGTLYFQATDGVNGHELWKSDGTSAGTTLVADVRSGSTGSFPVELTNVGGTLYFAASDGATGQELWKSDGTSAGTTLVNNINPGAADSFPEALRNVSGTLYFTADNGATGKELFRSNGTSTGTFLVKDIQPGTQGAFLGAQIVNVNGVLAFAANDGTRGTELWISDGTSSGTTLVKDINPNAGSSYPFGLTNVDGFLFFSASDGSNGTEIWGSDGTSTGTGLFGDINAGSNSSSPSSLTNFNNVLLFAADDGTRGAELWKLVDSQTPLDINLGATANTVIITFTSQTAFTVSIDGAAATGYDTGTNNVINLNTGGGADTVLVYLSTLVDTASLNGTGGSVTSSNYTINFTSVETKFLFGGTGDRATYTDAGSVSLLYTLPTHAIMLDSLNTYFNETVGFGGGYTGNATGNDDYFFMYGGAAADTFTTTPTQASGSPDGVATQGNNFKNIITYGLGGADAITFNGSASNEVLTSLSSVFSVLFSTQTLQYFVGYPSVTVNSGGGTDQAVMYDSTGDDTFTGSFTSSVNSGTGFSNTVNNYAQVYAWNYFGGNDTAILNGSGGNDVAANIGGTPRYAILSSGSLIQQALLFHSVVVNGGAGTDSATLEDFAGNDTLVAAGADATITNELLFSVRFNGFEAVHAVSKNGGTNRLTRNAPTFTLTTAGTWV